MDRNKAYRTFHALLSELGLREQKPSILAGYGVSSAAELTDAQLSAAISSLYSEASRREDAAQAELRRWRSAALRLLTDIGVYRVGRGESKAAVWNRVNVFMAQSRIAGCLFYDLDVEGLRTLCRKLRALKDRGYYARPAAEEIKPAVNVICRTSQIPS